MPSDAPPSRTVTDKPKAAAIAEPPNAEALFQAEAQQETLIAPNDSAVLESQFTLLVPSDTTSSDSTFLSSSISSRLITSIHHQHSSLTLRSELAITTEINPQLNLAEQEQPFSQP
ncbi:unnamed protein product [Penicillium glandicola]